MMGLLEFGTCREDAPDAESAQAAEEEADRSASFRKTSDPTV